HLRKLFGDEASLEIPSQLQLVSVVDLVDELHGEEQREQKRRHGKKASVELDPVIHGLLRTVVHRLPVPLDLRAGEGKEEEHQHCLEEDAPGRSQPPGQSEEDTVGGLEESLPALALALDRIPVLSDQLAFGALPFARVEPFEILPTDSAEGRAQ